MSHRHRTQKQWSSGPFSGTPQPRLTRVFTSVRIAAGLVMAERWGNRLMARPLCRLERRTCNAPKHGVVANA